ncbi:ABC transporter substrate-binding protein [Falsiroseomonas sp.]|uniref:ABC transporter substrate-binding protein n=1 Tax=Falsiroseomonas sp. TaxID=2870721 RepID=UPI003F72DC98
MSGIGRRSFVALGALAGPIPIGLRPARAQGRLQDAILRLNFTPWGMHAQYYAGLKQNIYRSEGINLEIRPAAAGQQNEVFIAAGREQFLVANADGYIKSRAANLPVIAVMADQPDNPFSVFSLKTSNITKPADMRGKKITWFQSQVRGLLDPLLASGGLTRNDITFLTVSRGAEVQIVAAGQAECGFGFSYGQPLTLEDRGFPCNVMALKDFGVKFAGTQIVANEREAQRGDLTERFVRATMKSLIWTRDNMDTAMNYVIEVAPDRNHALEVRKLRIIYDLYRSPDFGQRFGRFDESKWESSINYLMEGGDLQRRPTARELYTNDFVDRIPEALRLSALVHGRAAS